MDVVSVILQKIIRSKEYRGYDERKQLSSVQVLKMVQLYFNFNGL